MRVIPPGPAPAFAAIPTLTLLVVFGSALAGLAPALRAQSTQAASLSLIKIANYTQTAAGLTLVNHAIKSRVTLTEVPTLPVGATLEVPSGLTDQFVRAGADSLEFNQNYASAAVLDARYPNGPYSVRLAGPRATTYGGLLLPTAVRPDAAVLANFAALQAIATPERVTITLAPAAQPLRSDVLLLTIRSVDQTFYYSSADAGLQLDGSTREVTVSLPPGQEFVAELMLFRGSVKAPDEFFPYWMVLGTGSLNRFAMATLFPAPTITSHPISHKVISNGSVTLNVTASGANLSYQWRLNGANIPGATAATLRIDSVQPAHAGNYSVVVTNPGGSVTSASATLAVSRQARLVNLATRGHAGSGPDALVAGFVLAGSGSKTVLIRGIGPGLTAFGLSEAETLADPILTLAAASGETVGSNDDWELAELTPLHAATAAAGAFALQPSSRDAALLVGLPAGAYTATVSGKNGAHGVAMVEVYDVDAQAPEPRLVNLASRAAVGPGAQTLIPGFVVTGDLPRNYLLRGVGPTLSVFNLEGTLQDPVLTLFRGGNSIRENDDWSLDPSAAIETATAAGRVGAFNLLPSSRDAAFVLTLDPGAYTFQLTGKEDTSGVALVEVYEIP